MALATARKAVGLAVEILKPHSDMAQRSCIFKQRDHQGTEENEQQQQSTRQRKEVTMLPRGIATALAGWRIVVTQEVQETTSEEGTQSNAHETEHVWHRRERDQESTKADIICDTIAECEDLYKIVDSTCFGGRNGSTVMMQLGREMTVDEFVVMHAGEREMMLKTVSRRKSRRYPSEYLNTDS